MEIIKFIKNPLNINTLIVNKNIEQFEVEFKDLIIDRNVNTKTFQIYKLKNKIEVTFYKRKFYQILLDTSDDNIFYKDIIIYFENFKELDNDINDQKNILLPNNIELVFDSITRKLEKTIYTDLNE